MNNTYKNFLFKDAVELEDLGDGIKRQILGRDADLMLVRIWFETGAVGTPHEHMHSQVTYVESGEFEFTVGDESHLVKAGDSVYMPPHVRHGAVCKKAGVLVDAFSPTRQDFLEGKYYED